MVLFKWIKSKNLQTGLIAAIIFGCLVGFKVYVGAFAALGLAVLGCYFLLKKQIKMLIPIAITALISVAIFFPSNRNAGGLFWSPLSWPRHYFAQGIASQLNWHLQEQVFRAFNNKPRLALLHTQMAISFLIITLGTRIIGILGLFKSRTKTPTTVFLFLSIPAVIFTAVPLFFLQKTGLFEGFNFIAVASTIWSLYAALLVSLLSKSNKGILKIAAFAILALTIPRSVHEAIGYYHLYSSKSGLYINQNQFKFFDEVKKKVNLNQTILVDPRDPLDNYSPYIAAFTGRRMFYSGGGILDAHGLRQDELNSFTKDLISQSDPTMFHQALSLKGIDFFLENQSPPLAQLQDKQYFRPVASNEEAVLYEIK